MKGSQIGRGALAAILSLAAALSITACSRDYTVAFVYATTAKPLAGGSLNGGVTAYGVDFQSGALTQLVDSPIAAGKNPITLVAAPNGKEIYVVNRDDSTISPFAIGTDGKLYPAAVKNLKGSLGSGIAIDPAGTFLYVTYTYQLGPGGQTLYTPSSPGPGGLTIFPINADGTLGDGSFLLLGNNPVAVAVSPFNHYVYVIDQEASPNATVLGFSQNPKTGALTPLAGTTISTGVDGKTVATGYRAGIAPSAITVDPTGHFVYVTDQAANQVIGYVINGSTTPGALTPLTSSPFPTGLFPVGITIDPRGQHLYVANYNSNSISQYEINVSTGNLTGGVGLGGTAVPTGPTCVTVEPARGIYLYTSNNLDGTVSGEQLDPHTGGLQQVQNTPFPASGLPTCVVSVGNGSHPSSLAVN